VRCKVSDMQLVTNTEFVPHTPACIRGVKIQNHSFVTSATVGSDVLASRPGLFNPGTHLMENCVDPTAGRNLLEEINVLLPAQIPTPDRSAGRLITIMTELSRVFSLC
jgi:hypothetical protein